MTTRVLLRYVMISILIATSCSSPSSYIISSGKGYVPDEATAIKIAETLWYPVYGDAIFKEQPFVATLKNEVWIVQGTITTDVGGALYIEIRKKDCKILKMYHGK